MFKQPQTRDKIIDVKMGMKNKDAERIKDLEKELSELRDIRRLNENLEKKSSKNEKRYNDEKKKREEFERLKDELEF